MGMGRYVKCVNATVQGAWRSIGDGRSVVGLPWAAVGGESIERQSMVSERDYPEEAKI